MRLAWLIALLLGALMLLCVDPHGGRAALEDSGSASVGKAGELPPTIGQAPKSAADNAQRDRHTLDPPGVLLVVRAVSTDNGAPIQGVRITAGSSVEDRISGVTDQTGAARLKLPAGVDCTLTWRDPPGLESSGSPLRLKAHDAGAQVEVVLDIRAAPRKSIVGRVLDEQNMRPLPSVNVHLRGERTKGDGETWERLRTDVEGYFHSEFTYLSGSVIARFEDPAPEGQVVRIASRRFQHLASGSTNNGEYTFLLGVGPTVHFDLLPELGSDIEGLKAKLLPREKNLTGAQTPQALVRGPVGARWARFSVRALDELGPPPWRLQVLDPQRRRHGSALLHGTRPLEEQRPRVTLRPSGGVRLELVGLEPSELEAVLWRISSAEASAADAIFTGWRGIVPDHEPEIDWLTPGPYDLVVWAPKHASLRRRLLVTAGAVARVRCELAPAERLGVDNRVAGRVSSRSGRFDGQVSVVVKADHTGLGLLRQSVVWQEVGGVLEGTFEFALPTSTPFVLDATLLDTEHLTTPVEPPSIVVIPPREQLEFVVEDTVDLTPDLRVRVIDADSGIPLESWSLAWLPATPGTETSFSVSDSNAFLGFASLGRFSVGRMPRAYVVARGRRGVLLDEDAWEDARTPSDLADAWELVVPLERGWSALFRALNDKGEVLTGVRFQVGDEAVAWSDPSGLALVSFEVRPRGLTAWAECGGSEDPAMEVPLHPQWSVRPQPVWFPCGQ